MSTAKANKKKAAVAVALPECPVCIETMTAPIYQCKSGHSICNTCNQRLLPPLCPICRQDMTQMRNWQLEEIIAKAKVPCPNRQDGCVYTMASAEVENHLKECIFRIMECPLGVVFGRCSWHGKLTEMMAHFKERHPYNCNISTDADVNISNVDLNVDERHVYLVAQAKMLFIVTMKIDTLNKIAYWVIQHIGSKKVANQHIYEIHVSSKHEPKRKVTFTEYCFNNAIKTDDIYRQAKCAILTLDSLNQFIKDGNLSFRFFIKRLPVPKNKEEDEEGQGNNPLPYKGPKGPGPKNPGTNFNPKYQGKKKFDNIHKS